jgi:hypothetical protein
VGIAMRRRVRRARCCLAGAVVIVVATVGITARHALAYSAAGDRLFPATLTLPQIAPGDEFYGWSSTLPHNGELPGAPTRSNNLHATYMKTLTERLGIVIEEQWTRLDRAGRRPSYGWQNLDMELKYSAIVDQPHEFLLTFGLDREFGGTGARNVGAFSAGATTPRVYFGKGLGDLDIGYLRPLAITGLAGYQLGDSRPRPNLINAGVVVEYSIPYLQSKVQSHDLPELVRGLTPMTEFQLAIPSGRSFGARTTFQIAPGVSYAGEGWELAVEALLPATRATGRGVGVIAQFHLSLDYVAAETIGRPLFSAR